MTGELLELVHRQVGGQRVEIAVERLHLGKREQRIIHSIAPPRDAGEREPPLRDGGEEVVEPQEPDDRDSRLMPHHCPLRLARTGGQDHEHVRVQQLSRPRGEARILFRPFRRIGRLAIISAQNGRDGQEALQPLCAVVAIEQARQHEGSQLSGLDRLMPADVHRRGRPLAQQADGGEVILRGLRASTSTSTSTSTSLPDLGRRRASRQARSRVRLENCLRRRSRHRRRRSRVLHPARGVARSVAWRATRSAARLLRRHAKDSSIDRTDRSPNIVDCLNPQRGTLLCVRRTAPVSRTCHETPPRVIITHIVRSNHSVRYAIHSSRTVVRYTTPFIRTFLRSARPAPHTAEKGSRPFRIGSPSDAGALHAHGAPSVQHPSAHHSHSMRSLSGNGGRKSG